MSIFLDTNIFIHYKSFISIDWLAVTSKSGAKILIIIPYIVLKELDEKKYNIKKARKTISKFKKLENTNLEFQKNVHLILPDRPPDWRLLNGKQRELLDKGINDDHILTEILIYISQNPSAEIVVITGDYTFRRRLKSYNIKTIDPDDDEYLVFFKTETPEIARRRPDLQLLFKNRQDSIELNIEGIEIRLIEYKEEEEEVKDIRTIVANLTNPMIKAEETYIEEIKEYNKKLVEYSKYKEISFSLSNNANHPYRDIHIFIAAELEQGFDFKFKEDFPKPEKPSRYNAMLPLSSPNNYIFPDLTEPEERHSKPEKTLTKKGTVIWVLGYRIKSLNHQLIRNLEPILIKIPENVKTNVISLYCEFAHEELGTIKRQKLKINLKK